MPIGKPLLPLKKSTTDIVDTINKTLKEKHWHKFELATAKLILVPHYFFHYHYFVEKEVGNDKIVEGSFSGRLLIDAEVLKVIEKKELDELLHHVGDATNVDPQIPFEVKEALIAESEEAEVIKIKSSEHFKVPRTNILISHRKTILVPYFVTFITVKEGTFRVKMNAVTGEINGIEKLPKRERGYLEITAETLKDLKRPGAWAEYSVGLIKETRNLFSDNNKETQEKSVREENLTSSGLEKFLRKLLESKTILLVIIFLALLMIYAALIQMRVL